MATSSTRRVDRSSPPVEVPKATSDAVGRRLVPVDGGRDLAGRVGRVDQDAARAVDGRGDRPDDEGGAVAVAPAVDREELVAADRGRQRGARLR